MSTLERATGLDQAKELIDRADAFHKEGSYDRACIYYRAAIEVVRFDQALREQMEQMVEDDIERARRLA